VVLVLDARGAGVALQKLDAWLGMAETEAGIGGFSPDGSRWRPRAARGSRRQRWESMNLAGGRRSLEGRPVAGASAVGRGSAHGQRGGARGRCRAWDGCPIMERDL
jgi:hypothetical protein